MAQLLIIEADPLSAEQLHDSLCRAGYHVQCAHDYGLALQILATRQLDLIIASERQGPGPARQLIAEIRRVPVRPAVIVLGERSYDSAVAAFRAGATDYLHLPCAPARLEAAVQAALHQRSQAEWPLQALHEVREQLAAMQALLARLEAPEHRSRQDSCASDGPQPTASQIVVGPLNLGRGHRRVLLNGEQLATSPIEYRLLRCLAETPDKPVSFRQIVMQTHAYDAADAEASGLLKSHLRNLRRKLPAGCLVAVRGVGVMLSMSGLAQPTGDKQPC